MGSLSPVYIVIDDPHLHFKVKEYYWTYLFFFNGPSILLQLYKHQSSSVNLINFLASYIEIMF